MRDVRRLFVAVNPRGGKSSAADVFDQVRPTLEAAGVQLDVHGTEYAGHAREMINTMDMSNYDGFCAVGGDGTLHELANGLLARKDGKQIPIGLIPAGSGNSFMQTIDCTDPQKAAAHIVNGNIVAIDAVEVQTGGRIVYSINLIGWGLAAAIGATAERIRWLGENRYTIAAVIEILKGKQRPARLVLPERTVDDDFTLVMALITRYTGKGMLAAPKAQIDDGLVDLVVIRRSKRFKILSVFPKIFDGTHIDEDIVEYYQVEEFSLIPRVDEPLNIDGEIMGTTPFKARVRPRAIPMFIHRGSSF
jgi:YegS/Rv2252/BmrU family lipid kinase